MDKNNKLCKFAPDYEECSSRYNEIETYIKNPEKFIEVIKDNPNLVFSDKVIQRVISIFQDVCKLGTPEESETAKSILIDVGMPAFIPQEARVKRSKSMHYRWYKQNPMMLIWQVEYQKTLIQPYIKPTYRGRNGEMAFHEKDKDILTAFENIIGFKPEEEEAYILTDGERNKDLTHISLSFLCFNPGDSKEIIPFESLKDLYYEIIKQNKKEKQHIAENVLDEIPFAMNGMIGYFEFVKIINS